MTPQIFDSLGELEIACNNPRLAHEWLVRGPEFRHDSLASGRALDLEDAIAFALSSRGESAPAARASAASLLTTREREVARLLARGFSNRQIADELVISLHTAQRHVENILGKHGFSSRAQVAAWAVGEGLSGEAPRP